MTLKIMSFRKHTESPFHLPLLLDGKIEREDSMPPGQIVELGMKCKKTQALKNDLAISFPMCCKMFTLLSNLAENALKDRTVVS